MAGADRPGTTIIFVKNQRHPEFIRQRFGIAHPEYAGKFAQVVTHATDYASR
ncbi:hypothetical protein [Propionibacterium sp.]|uniref:hypothetical protein n=1 Tax=Propionibacterium sp. TaxID=1977903 RepID=UPI0039E7A0AE